MRSVSPPTVVAPLAFLLLAAGIASSAAASHPSQPVWTVELQSAAGPGCMGISKDDDQRGVFSIDNLCGDTMTIDSATCSPAICEVETIEIQDGASRALGSDSFGFDSEDVQEGESVHVEFNPSLGGNEQPTIAVEFTYEGWSDASHGGGDAGADATADTAGGDTDETDRDDVAVSSDAAGTDEESDDGGCSTTGRGPMAPLFACLLITMGPGLGTRGRG